MPNDTEITPAMSAEEWADLSISRENDDLPIGDGTEAGITELGRLRIGAEEFGPGIDVVERDRHAVAALALHDQPFGFTWADVDRCRDIARTIEAHYAKGGTFEDAGSAGLIDPWIKLADRIAALLPPR